MINIKRTCLRRQKELLNGNTSLLLNYAHNLVAKVNVSLSSFHLNAIILLNPETPHRLTFGIHVITEGVLGVYYSFFGTHFFTFPANN